MTEKLVGAQDKIWGPAQWLCSLSCTPLSSCLQYTLQAILLLLLSLEEYRWYKTIDNPKTMRNYIRAVSEWLWAESVLLVPKPCTLYIWVSPGPAKIQAVLNPPLPSDFILSCTFAIRLYPKLPAAHLLWLLWCYSPDYLWCTVQTFPLRTSFSFLQQLGVWIEDRSLLSPSLDISTR